MSLTLLLGSVQVFLSKSEIKHRNYSFHTMSCFIFASIVTILSMIATVNSIDFQCAENYVGRWDYASGSYSCRASGLKVIAVDVNVTTLNGKSDFSNLQLLEISNQVVNFLPKDLDKFFPNLQGFQVFSSNLKSIRQKDLKPFKNLMHLNFRSNDLEMVESDLFEFNQNLKYVNFNDNKLKIIGVNILTPLINMQIAYFQNNYCISDYEHSSGKESLSTKFKTRCGIPQVLKTRFENLEEEIQTEKSNTLRLLLSFESKYKSCDANLDSAGENLLITSHELASCISNDDFVQAVAEIQEVNVKGIIENVSFTAIDFKIKFNNSRIEKVKSEKGEVVDSNAIKTLKIREQQTLFLPLNLEEHFKNLSKLSVEASGLFQIDALVFKGLKLLSTLKLGKNKLIEIPSDAFDELTSLTELYLSMNKLKSLEHGVFKGLANLSKLQLNDNFLVNINYEILQNLKQLKELSLQNNKLKFISANIFSPLTQLTSVDITNNVCINVSLPNIELKEIEAMIIDNCIEPIELDCKSTINVMRLELTVVQTVLICEAELVVNYPKTKIANLTSFHATTRGVDNNVIVFSAINQTMKFLPYQLSKNLPKLTMIFIERSQLTAIQKHDFEGLTKLKKIIVHHNNLTTIEEEAFDDVKQIEELDLSFNSIQALPPKIFLHLVNLKRLILSNNQIKKFTADFLPRTNALEEFSVNKNELEMIETKTLRFLRKAKQIDLSGNTCIDRKFEKNEGNLEALLKLSGEIDLFCSEDDLQSE